MSPLIACPMCGHMWELDAEKARRESCACEKCGASIMTRADREAKVCPTCGSSFDEGLDKCPDCAKPPDESAR